MKNSLQRLPGPIGAGDWSCSHIWRASAHQHPNASGVFGSQSKTWGAEYFARAAMEGVDPGNDIWLRRLPSLD